MKNDTIMDTIKNILSHQLLHIWEDVSDSYVNIILSKIVDGDMYLLYNQKSNQYKLSYAVRYLKSYGCRNLNLISYQQKENNVEINKTIVQRISNAQSKYLFIIDANIEALEYLQNILGETIIPLNLPNFIPRKEEFYLYFKHHTNEIEYIIKYLTDELSRNCLIELMRCCAENDIFRLSEGTQIHKYFECYKHLDNEVWLNIGSSFGDTIASYVYNQYKFNTIYAVETDPQAARILEMNIETIRRIIPSESVICLVNKKFDAFNNTIDKFLAKNEVTLINMDIEGAEFVCLNGGKIAIETFAPVLAICVYHKCSDMYHIMNLVNTIRTDYNFYLRKYCSYLPGAFNEFVLYCVPSKRKIL